MNKYKLGPSFGKKEPGKQVDTLDRQTNRKFRRFLWKWRSKMHTQKREVETKRPKKSGIKEGNTEAIFVEQKDTVSVWITHLNWTRGWWNFVCAIQWTKPRQNDEKRI